MDTSKPMLIELTNQWDYAFSLPTEPEDDSFKTLSDTNLRTLEEMLSWYCRGGTKHVSTALRGYIFCIFYNLLKRERVKRHLPPP